MSYVEVAPSPGRFAWRVQLSDLAEFHGWRCHPLVATWGPDLLLIRRPRLLWVFAEPERGRLSRPRLAAFVELKACRQDVVLWRPDALEAVGRTLA